MFFIIFILANIFSSIRPTEFSLSIHLIFLPLTFVNSSIRPFISSKPFYPVLLKLTFINWTISPLETSLAMFITFFIKTFVSGSILTELLDQLYLQARSQFLNHAICHLSILHYTLNHLNEYICQNRLFYPLSMILRKYLHHYIQACLENPVDYYTKIL